MWPPWSWGATGDFRAPPGSPLPPQPPLSWHTPWAGPLTPSCPSPEPHPELHPEPPLGSPWAPPCSHGPSLGTHPGPAPWALPPPTPLPPPRADNYILQEAWERATELSEAAGVEYKGRDGLWRYPKQDDSSFVGEFLHRFCDENGMEYK